MSFSWDDIPEGSGGNKVEEGVHTLRVASLNSYIASTGSVAVQMSHELVNVEKFKINYDNAYVINKSGAPIPFGLNKLKKIAAAAGLELPKPKSLEDFKSPAFIKILSKTLVGAEFNAELTYGEENAAGKSYLGLNNIDSIESVSMAKAAEVSPSAVQELLDEDDSL